MLLSYCLVLSVLVLAPFKHFQRCSLNGANADYAPCINEKKKDNSEDNFIARPCYSGISKENNQPPLLAKVRYESSNEKKCTENKKLKEDEVCHEEIETIKEAASKWQSSMAEKSRKMEQGTCKPSSQKIFKEELKCSLPMKKGNYLCADCEQCELQIKADGEGVVLKCKDCREVPSSEVIFPAGNNRRIIRLP